MHIYNALQQLSAAIGEITSTPESAEGRVVAVHRLFWHAAPAVGDALVADLVSHLKCMPLIHTVEFHFLDPFFRQSATSIVFMMKFVDDPDFLLRVECMVDHGSVMLSVRRHPDQRSPLAAVADHIQRNHLPGAFDASLRDLPPFEPRSRWWR